MKVRFGILWAILAVALLVGIPVLLFSTVSGTYTPPASGTVEAQIPPLPAPASQGASTQADVVQAITAETSPEAAEENQRSASDGWIEAQAKAFYERHPTLPEKTIPSCPDDVRPDLFDLGFAVLMQIESDKALMELVRHSDAAVRAAAIRALDAARCAMAEGGVKALISFLGRQSQHDLEWLLLADTEVLIDDTRTGTMQGRGGGLLHRMGDYGRPAIAHLSWASDNHPDPALRAGYMSQAVMLDPDATEVQSLLGRRLSDPDPEVRLEALFRTVTAPVVSYLYERGQYPPWYLQLRPGDTAPEAGESVTPVPVERKSVALAANSGRGDVVP